MRPEERELFRALHWSTDVEYEAILRKLTYEELVKEAVVVHLQRCRLLYEIDHARPNLETIKHDAQ